MTSRVNTERARRWAEDGLRVENNSVERRRQLCIRRLVVGGEKNTEGARDRANQMGRRVSTARRGVTLVIAVIEAETSPRLFLTTSRMETDNETDTTGD